MEKKISKFSSLIYGLCLIGFAMTALASSSSSSVSKKDVDDFREGFKMGWDAVTENTDSVSSHDATPLVTDLPENV